MNGYACKSRLPGVWKSTVRRDWKLRIPQAHRPRLGATGLKDEEGIKKQMDKTSSETTTEKYGLEFGLFRTLTDKSASKASKTENAKALLTKYGSAYLLTSISFAIVSFGICYFLVSAGIDVAALLSKVGLDVNLTSERVGRFAIAYAAHKAASPIRFPPTVALTPVVAKWMGKGKTKE